MIYGISGKKRSGKDTVGKILQILLNGVDNIPTSTVLSILKSNDNGYLYKIQKFANPLKQIVCILIGCTMEQLEDEDFKNKELNEDWWVTPHNGLMIDYLSAGMTFETIKWTPRLLLQVIGTNLFKERISNRIWINTGKNVMEDNSIITDVRFPEEAYLLRDKRAILIRVETNRFEHKDKHLSETALDNFKGFDYTIINDGTLEDLIEQVKLILKYGRSN